MLPNTAEYAVRAVLHIAAHDRPVRVAEIAAASRIPCNYLSKTLHQLARAGILTSARGRGGGFRLTEPADRVTLQRIISPFATPSAQQCLLGDGKCREVGGCAAHARWSPVANQMTEFFDTTTVADLLTVLPSTRGAQP